MVPRGLGFLFPNRMVPSGTCERFPNRIVPRGLAFLLPNLIVPRGLTSLLPNLMVPRGDRMFLSLLLSGYISALRFSITDSRSASYKLSWSSDSLGCSNSVYSWSSSGFWRARGLAAKRRLV